MISVSAIASAGNGAHFSFGSTEAPEPQETPASPAPEDSLPKVRKTDYPNDELPKKYAFDFKDPENLQTEAGEYDEKSGY